MFKIIFNKDTMLPFKTTWHPAKKEAPTNWRWITSDSIKIKSVDPDNPEPIERVDPEKQDEDDNNRAACVTFLDCIGAV